MKLKFYHNYERHVAYVCTNIFVLIPTILPAGSCRQHWVL